MEQQRSNELHSLFLCLIQSCANGAAVSEQRSLAQFIDTMFTSAAESCASTYAFLTPQISPVKGTDRRKKEEAPKSKKTTPTSSKRKVKAGGTGSRSSVPLKVSPTLGNSIKSQDDVLQQLFKAIELSPDDMVIMLLCRLLQGYVTYCKNTDVLSQLFIVRFKLAIKNFGARPGFDLDQNQSCLVSQKRLRRITRLDGANYLLRTIRSHFVDTNPSPARILAIDALARALMIVSGKDQKLMLKVRISGILPQLANRILESDRLFTTVTLLRLASRCLRSARNAQVIGREKHFAERFVAILNAFTAMMDYSAMPSSVVRISASSSSIASASGSSNGFSLMELPSPSVLLHCKTNLHKEEPVNPAKMARLVEVLFFTAKNKHNKSQLLDNDALSVLKTIFENHFERRRVNAVHLEISLITAATIRQFSKTKKGKEQLQRLSIQTMCEKYIGLLTEDRQLLADRPKTLVLYSQLQDSLCALCLRCLPQVPFPMEKAPFPLKYPLPVSSDNMENTGTPLPRDNAASSSNKRVFLTPKLNVLKQSTPSSSRTPEKQDDGADEAASSDDDICDEEEEDSLFIFNASGEGCSTSLLQANETEANYSDEDEDAAMNNADTKVEPAYVIANYSRQNLAELKSNYREHFIELEQDAITTGDSSPKLRKTVNSSRSDIGVSSGPKIEFGRPSPSLPLVVSATKRGDISYKDAILEIANHTKSVAQFVKIAYPELVDVGELTTEPQPLLPPTDSMREMVTNEVNRSRMQSKFERKVVYDLDQLLLSTTHLRNPPTLGNQDLQRIGHRNKDVFNLCFESRFESGNLRRVVQVSPTHYELILSPDINSSRPHYQWFYFEVSNNEANVPYTFEIINCRKNSSMFSRGMQPVLFSVTDASRGNPGWIRSADSVCYYRNLYVADDADEKPAGRKDRKDTAVKSSTPKKGMVSTRRKSTENAAKSDLKKSTAAASGNAELKNYFSIRFRITFQHVADVCYIAYHFPYTYSYLNATLENVLARCSPETSNVYMRTGVLTKTLAGNTVHVVTITAPGSVREVHERKIVLFSARVHPGESNSSWIMHGILKYLTSPAAAKARELFVFKIMPMLNPDGVINGSHRCSLAGVDLNRVYNCPSEKLHPTIFHTKGLIQYMTEVAGKRPFVFVDLHGHSRKSNIFVYGNNPEESWRTSDHSIDHNYQFMALPEILGKTAPSFHLSDCRFSVTKGKEFSARIAMWRQFGIERAYTMEASYCGFDSGSYTGKQMTTAHLMEMGANLCETLVQLKMVGDEYFPSADGAKAMSTPTRTPSMRLSAKRAALFSDASKSSSNTSKSADSRKPIANSSIMEASSSISISKESKPSSKM